MEYDSVLGQQSISGKNVSLILCVWKPCYVKSGHIYTWNMHNKQSHWSDIIFSAHSHGFVPVITSDNF